MRCATELKGVTFNIKLRFLKIMGRYDRCNSVCQASDTKQKLRDHYLHLPDGAEDGYISTPRTSSITWMVFVHKQTIPFAVHTRQSVTATSTY